MVVVVVGSSRLVEVVGSNTNTSSSAAAVFSYSQYHLVLMADG